MTDENNNTRRPLTQQEVERMLAAFGADRTRWSQPSTTRPPLSVVSRDAALSRLEAEERALDAVLARGKPAPDAARLTALTDRIVAAAERMPRLAAATEGPADAIKSAPASDRAAPPLRWSAYAQRRDLWRSFGAIAACLVFGISVGQSGVMDSTWRGFEDITGISLESTPFEMARALTAAETLED